MVHEIFINCLSFSITVLVRFASELLQKQNLRTVIVTADIHQGLYQPAHNLATMYHR